MSRRCEIKKMENSHLRTFEALPTVECVCVCESPILSLVCVVDAGVDGFLVGYCSLFTYSLPLLCTQTESAVIQRNTFVLGSVDMRARIGNDELVRSNH